VLREPPYQLHELYAPGLPKVAYLEHILQGLLNTRMPKLAAHFRALNVLTTMYAAQWFLTIFTYNFPFAVVVRVWDAFLSEGWKVVFRVALGVLKTNEGACAFAAAAPQPASFTPLPASQRPPPPPPPPCSHLLGVPLL